MSVTDLLKIALIVIPLILALVIAWKYRHKKGLAVLSSVVACVLLYLLAIMIHYMSHPFAKNFGLWPFGDTTSAM
jgi:hypothetical protein